MDYNERLNNSYDYETLIDICKDVKEFRKDIKNEDKIGWYLRYRKESTLQKSLLINELNYEVNCSDMF